jgi:hypothetical protein
MKITKAQRQQIKNKYAGLCAYCGIHLPQRWHVDHFMPIIRHRGGMYMPENDVIENCMPACPRCNISKQSLSIEDWRDWLQGHLSSLNKYSTPYKLMIAYGQIIETNDPKKLIQGQQIAIEIFCCAFWGGF